MRKDERPWSYRSIGHDSSSLHDEYLSSLINVYMPDKNAKSSYLLLKWGTLKGWGFESQPEALPLLQEYSRLGRSMGAATQHDTLRQKEIICELIDICNGIITNDWSGEEMTRSEAKKYVMEY